MLKKVHKYTEKYGNIQKIHQYMPIYENIRKYTQIYIRQKANFLSIFCWKLLKISEKYMKIY
jgi:hypothetical protein